MAVGDAYVFPGFLTPVQTQLFFPKPPTTFLTCSCRGERRKFAEKKSRLNRGSNLLITKSIRFIDSSSLCSSLFQFYCRHHYIRSEESSSRNDCHNSFEINCLIGQGRDRASCSQDLYIPN